MQRVGCNDTADFSGILLVVLAIKVFLSAYIFNSLSKNNPIKLLVFSLGEYD